MPELVLNLSKQIEELKEIIEKKLQAPDGYEPDITMTAAEVAKYMGCTVDNVHKKRKSGHLPYHQTGKVVFFKKKDIDQATRVKPYKQRFFE